MTQKYQWLDFDLAGTHGDYRHAGIVMSVLPLNTKKPVSPTAYRMGMEAVDAVRVVEILDKLRPTIARCSEADGTEQKNLIMEIQQELYDLSCYGLEPKGFEPLIAADRNRKQQG